MPDELNASAGRGSIEQQFNIHGKNVRPEIIARDSASFRHAVDLRVPHKLLFNLRSNGAASYQVALRRGSNREILDSATIEGASARVISLAPGRAEIEFLSNGKVVWQDLRVVRPVFLWPAYFAIAALLLAVGLWRRCRLRGRAADVVTLFGSALLCLVIAEILMRHLGARLPASIVAARAELGLVGEDIRLIDPSRYKVRLKPNLQISCAWQYGDIARLGFVAPAVNPATPHRYRVHTDAEGFRNDMVRTQIDIAALGDSFTDGMTGPAAESWPMVLERLTGRSVQNYGTSGFGPQQELYVLRDYALQHRPKWVVLAFFAGNDLHDAEVFDDWERAGRGGAADRSEGWKPKRSFRRYETLYVWSLMRVFARELRSLAFPQRGIAAPVPENVAGVFDRGMFTVRTEGRVVRFAFLPPYLQQLGRTRAEIERMRGWAITQSALRDMKDECARSGAAFVLMFVPEKAQVYWPLATRVIASPVLQRAMEFYGIPADASQALLESIHRNRLAQNEVLREFCAREEIPMLDLTPTLAREAEADREVYFPDDTHWNAAGHEVAARELAHFLTPPR